jgi:hypothetical protein
MWVGISNFPTTTAGRTKRQTIVFGKEMVGSLLQRGGNMVLKKALAELKLW